VKALVSKEKELYYKELNKIFGEDGVKKSIISGIIKPINHFIKENIKKMGLRFEVGGDWYYRGAIITVEKSTKRNDKSGT
jgi:hypothetical protein